MVGMSVYRAIRGGHIGTALAGHHRVCVVADAPCVFVRGASSSVTETIRLFRGNDVLVGFRHEQR